MSTKTNEWIQSMYKNDEGYKPLSIFTHNPPVKSAYTSNRILFVGTNAEYEELVKKYPELENAHKARNATTFFENFFNKENYLDGLEGRSVPKKIFATGNIRITDGSSTYDLTGAFKRIREIAEMWDIPIKHLKC